MGLGGLVDEAKRHGEQVVRHWKLHEGLRGGDCPSTSKNEGKKAAAPSSGGLKAGIQEIRQIVENTLSGSAGVCSASSADDSALTPRVEALEKENKEVKTQLKDLKQVIAALQAELKALKLGTGNSAPAKDAPAPAAAKDEDEDEIDLFGSSDEEDDEEKEKIKQQRLEAYAAKKVKKPGPIAKSSVIFDIKPWDDETDMKALEKKVKEIEMDGLLWGASKLVPVAFGIMKLQQMCVVEDEKVSIDELTEIMEGFEDYVQSVDIAAFQKI